MVNKFYPECLYAVENEGETRKCSGEFIHLNASSTMCIACLHKNTSKEEVIKNLTIKLENQLYDQDKPNSSRHELYLAVYQALKNLKQNG